MRVLVNGCTPTVRKYVGRYWRHLGHLVQPRSNNRVDRFRTGLPWAADNDAIAGFNPDAYRRMLDGFYGQSGCLFVAAPDHVETACAVCKKVLTPRSKTCPDCDGPSALRGNAEKTFELFDRWYPELADRGLPVAIVAQDGMTPADLGHDFIRRHPALKVLFVGGSTEYKLSRLAGEVMRHCRLLGLWVHVGRVNSRARLHHVQSWRADSFDGTGVARAPDVVLARMLRFAEEAEGFLDDPDLGVRAAVEDSYRGFGPTFTADPMFWGYEVPLREEVAA
jgi:hypothetical protein